MWVWEVDDEVEPIALLLSNLFDHIPEYLCDFSYGLPPRLKGIIRLFMLETSVCSHKLLWALAYLSMLHDLFRW